MYVSPNPLPEKRRAAVAEALDATLSDGLDLHSQIKAAHWTIKGPQFAALHPLFETFAVALAGFNDEIAERAVTLGRLVHGSVRDVSRTTRLAEYPGGTTRDMELVQVLADRFDGHLAGVRKARAIAEEAEDTDTVDLLTQVVSEFEKNAWFLRATLDR
jgi:starvation-inducible DNA-binding protein